MMIDSQSDIISNVFNNRENKMVHLPVAFSYIINNVIGQQEINSNSLIDLSPLEAFNLIDEYYQQEITTINRR